MPESRKIMKSYWFNDEYQEARNTMLQHPTKENYIRLCNTENKAVRLQIIGR